MHCWWTVWTLITLPTLARLAVVSSLNISTTDDTSVSNWNLNRVLRSYTMGLHQMPCNNIGRRCNPLNPRASGCAGVCRPGRSVRRCRMFHGVPYCVPARIL